jgi:peroxiredoxin Q/BCP
MLAVGSVAPDFEATLDDGTLFRLSQQRGQKNVVLYFYPRDFSAGCTRQACSFRDSYASLRQYDAIIVGVSPDSAESHQAFRREHNLDYPLIADPDGRITDLYDVHTLLPLIRPRITYVIDKQGIIRRAMRHDLLIGKHLSEVREAFSNTGQRRGWLRIAAS